MEPKTFIRIEGTDMYVPKHEESTENVEYTVKENRCKDGNCE